MEFRAVDHVQLGMPPGEEERARAYFVGVLGMPLPAGMGQVGRRRVRAGQGTEQPEHGTMC